VTRRRKFDDRRHRRRCARRKAKTHEEAQAREKIQPSSGIRAIAPELSPQIRTPATANGFRPKRSARKPEASAPSMAPMPALISMIEVCPKVRCHFGANTDTRKPTTKKSKKSTTPVTAKRMIDSQ